MQPLAISDQDFERVRALAMRHAGISMPPSKKSLVEGRLRRRLQANGLDSYHDYLQLLDRPEARQELATAIDLLTTNETSFFREPKHFEHLRGYVLAERRYAAAFRVWSAACSSGEEPYSIAMLLAQILGSGEWQVWASDLSTRVLERARSGHYDLERANGIPQEYLRSYCLKGRGPQEGTFLIDATLRSRVQFEQRNLLEPVLRTATPFDVIFLRNVMIYFDVPTKRRVVHNLLPGLKPSGMLYIGHSETLKGVTDALTLVAPAIYRKPA